MKKHLFTAIIALFIPLFLYAQANKIEGTWFNEEKTSKLDVKRDLMENIRKDRLAGGTQ